MADGNNLQNTEQWHADRSGRSTASNYKAVMSKGRGGNPSESALTSMCEVIAGRLAGPARELQGVASLDHGNATEELAMGRYEWEGGEVEQSGFIVHPRFDFTGGSPDALIGTEGALECKCPINRGIHIKTVLRNEMPVEHIPQVQGIMFITGRSWVDFVSFYPSMPSPWDYFVKRIERDDEYIAQLEVKVCEFEENILAAMAAVTERNA